MIRLLAAAVIILAFMSGLGRANVLCAFADHASEPPCASQFHSSHNLEITASQNNKSGHCIEKCTSRYVLRSHIRYEENGKNQVKLPPAFIAQLNSVITSTADTNNGYFDWFTHKHRLPARKIYSDTSRIRI